MRNIRGLKAREESQRVQTWFQSNFTGYNTAGLRCALVSLRSDSREEENYFTEVGGENRAETKGDEMVSNEELRVACRSQRSTRVASTRDGCEERSVRGGQTTLGTWPMGVLTGEIWPAEIPH